jgi:hypothetical protein
MGTPGAMARCSCTVQVLSATAYALEDIYRSAVGRLYLSLELKGTALLFDCIYPLIISSDFV